MPIIDKSTHPLFSAIVGHSRVLFGVFIFLTLILGWQARNFKIDASADTLLLKNNRHYIQTQIINRRFSPQEFLLVAYQPHSDSIFSESSLANLKRLTQEIESLDRVESVRSILNVPLLSLVQGGLLGDGDVSQWTLENKDFTMDAVRDDLEGHPIYEDLLINKELTAASLQVLFKKDRDLDDLDEKILDIQKHLLIRDLTPEENSLLGDLKKKAGVLQDRLNEIRTSEIAKIRQITGQFEEVATLHLGGLHVLGFQLIQIIRNDLLVFGFAILGMICLSLYLFFKRPRWIVIPVVCCACSVVTTMGLFGFLEFRTTVISSNFIALQMILTLAIVIHLIVQYREYNANHADWTQDKLVFRTLVRKSGPCFFSGITTSMGFGSLIFSGIQPVIAFGWMMIIAMFCSLGVSLLLFPALMALFKREHLVKRREFSKHVLDGFRNLSLKRPVFIIFLFILLLAASVSGIFRLTVENSFLNYFRRSTKVYQELAFIDRHFGGSTPLDVTVTLPRVKQNDDLILDAETVTKLQKIQNSLQEFEAIGKVLSLVNFTALAKRINEDKPLTEYELTSLYRTMESSMRENLLGSFFDQDQGQARFSIRIRDTTEGLNRRDLLQQINERLRALDIAPDEVMLTNLFILYEEILGRLLDSQIKTLGIVYVVLLITFLILFRSFKIAIIGILPNISTTLAILGLMGWMGIPLDLMTITIAAIAMGIAVDDTIHYIHRYLEELSDHDADAAIRNTHGSVGYAIIYTSLVIIFGFSLLAFSDFVPSVLFGLLTGVAMLLALVTNLSMLPVLLHRFVRGEKEKNFTTEHTDHTESASGGGIPRHPGL